MRKVCKGREPNTLIQYRSSLTRIQQISESAYNDFPHKTRAQCNVNQAGNLRKILLEDQGYICCYCMSRISCKNSKIEHFRDQSTHRQLQLQFSNLYVACTGNEGESLERQHCDTSKGSSSLNYVNFNNNIENNIKYKISGIMFSNIAHLENDINDVLNLNYSTLINNRRNVYEAFIESMKSKYGSMGQWRKTNVTHEITKYSSKDSSRKYKEYCQMLICFLKKKEAQL